MVAVHSGFFRGVFFAFLGGVSGDRVAALIDCARQVRGTPFDLRIDEGRWWEHNGIVSVFE